ncbi:MAG: hypothetical protein NT037_18295 [Hyphomicrobiales bacterium]|nr:hypothetical protein [Hyphomicrobiales bacterium]
MVEDWNGGWFWSSLHDVGWCFFGAGFSQGFAGQFDPGGVMDDAIEVPDAPEAGCDHAPVAIVIAKLDAGRGSGSSICIVNLMMFDAGVASRL